MFLRDVYKRATRRLRLKLVSYVFYARLLRAKSIYFKSTGDVCYVTTDRGRCLGIVHHSRFVDWISVVGAIVPYVAQESHGSTYPVTWINAHLFP